MPFPTVKSDPWKKGLRKPRERFQLWPDKFWQRLCSTANELWDRGRNPFPFECVVMIGDMNELLYGHR